MRTLISISATLILAMPLTALADGPKIDTNGDKQISWQEFYDAGQRRWSNLDKNNDGVVTKDERKAAREQSREARAERRFEKTDKNADGVLSQEEVKARQEAVAARRSAMREKRKEKRKAWREAGEQKPPRGGAGTKLPRPDSNGDGVLDKAEHDAMLRLRFDHADVNKDGVLSRREMRRAHKMKKRMRKQMRKQKAAQQ